MGRPQICGWDALPRSVRQRLMSELYSTDLPVTSAWSGTYWTGSVPIRIMWVQLDAS